MRKTLNSFVILSLFFLVSCTTDLKDYQDRPPIFSMNHFFTGQLCAKGIVRNRDNSVSRKFVADILAESTENKVILDESFLFSDGEQQKRIWTFRKIGEQWIGNAGDVIGDAYGEIAGDTLHLTYQLKITLESDDIIVNMDDWLHLIDQNTLMGSTEISKWGINLGRIDISIDKSVCKK
jgi:hypothetical protein